MNAIVKLIEFGVEKTKTGGGTYTVTELTVKDEGKGDVKTYSVFANVPYHNLLTQLKAGERVVLTFTKNGKFSNLTNVERASAAPAVGASNGSAGGAGATKPSFAVADGERQLSICRQSSLKTATDLVSAMLASGLYKKSITPAFVEGEVMRLTRTFEGYTSLKADLKDLEADGSAVGGGRDDCPFEESEFPQ